MIYVIMGVLFYLSGDPLTVFESQLSFSGETIKSEYATIIAEGGSRPFVIVQSIDFMYMAVYGGLIFLIVNRRQKLLGSSDTPEKIERMHRDQFFLKIIRWFGPLAALCDGVENIYIHKMFSGMPNFPDEWAILHSSFAAVKWVLLISVILYYCKVRIKDKFTNFWVRLFDKLTSFSSYPKIWALLFAILPVVLLSLAITFFYTIWGQISIWPYTYPINGPSIGMIIVIVSMVLDISLTLYLEVLAFKLVKKGNIYGKFTRYYPKLFLKFILLVLIVGSSALGYVLSSVAQNSFYDAGPYLVWDNEQDPSNSITVCWHSSSRQNSEVLFGISPDNLDGIAMADMMGQYHWVPLENLAPNTQYYYEVQDQDFGIKSFKTGPSIGDYSTNFTFAMFADPRTNAGSKDFLNTSKPHNEIIADYIVDHLDSEGKELAFSIAAGDIVSRGSDLEGWRYWMNDCTSSDLSSSAALQIAIGNHEHHDDQGATNFHRFYPYETCNYSFTYGQVHVVVLDTYDYVNGVWQSVQFPQEQKEWAINDLVNHNSVPFKIIAIHQSAINNGQFSIDSEHHGNISQAIFDICDVGEVDLVFSGHSHHYESWNYTNTIFIEMGTGGNFNRGNFVYGSDTYDVIENGGEFIGGGGATTSWLQLDVTDSTMYLNTVLVNGSKIDPIIISA